MDRFFHKLKSRKMKWLIVLCSIALMIALLVSVVLSHYNIFTEDLGIVTGISARMINKDTIELRIKYQFPCGGYSVRVVPEDEGEYIGDGMIDYDGSLGKYRMMVKFGDIELSTALALKFAPSETVRLKNTPVKIHAKVASPEDHGFVLYIGSDQPISVEPVEQGTLNTLGGTIKIAISVGDDTDIAPLSKEEKAALVSDSFTSDTFFNVEEGDDLTTEEISSVISNIPSDQYEAYPDTHNIPLSATLYKDGKSISLERDDPRLIRLINFFNNCVYHSQCAYTQGLLSLETLENGITNDEFKLELTYAPYGSEGPSPYGKCTTRCNTIVITNAHSFTLIAHDVPGYEGQEDRYPFCAVGFYPLYDHYSWLDLFGF